MRRSGTPSWLLLAALLGAPALGAQPRNEDAQSLFREGTAAFEASDYRRALAAFERVYALRGNPDLLYNIFLCHRAMGEPGEAAVALRRYLVARPQHPERARLTELAAQLEADQRALSAQRAAPPPPPPPGPPAAPSPLPAPRATSSGPGAGPWIVLGGGVVAAGVGLALMLSANGQVDDAANASGERARADLLDGASTQHTVGVALLGVGAAAAVGGVLWRALAPGRAPTLSMGVGAGGVALTLGGRWP